MRRACKPRQPCLLPTHPPARARAAGRILNCVWHGYAVGVAGIVGFLPAKQCARPTARRIGQLQARRRGGREQGR